MFGESEFALRALAAILGVLGVVAVFFIGRGLHSNAAGLWAAGFAAVSAQQLQYSQFVRGYTLGFLAAALSIIALLQLASMWRAKSHGKRMPSLALYAAATTVAFYAHTTFFILPILANIYMAWLWLFRTRRGKQEAIRMVPCQCGHACRLRMVDRHYRSPATGGRRANRLDRANLAPRCGNEVRPRLRHAEPRLPEHCYGRCVRRPDWLGRMEAGS